MTTLIPFVPGASSPPYRATVTLDGTQYALSASWNIYRGEWYYTITDQSRTVIITAALVASPPDADIFLAPGLFTTSTILYRESTGNFEVTP